MRKHLIVSVAAAGLTVGLAVPSGAAAGPMAFEPIPGSAYGQESSDWADPFVIAEGYAQSRVSDESVLDIYPGADDLTDMNAVNETGPQAGRYLYRTHEVGSNGAVSAVDLQPSLCQTGQLRMLEIEDAQLEVGACPPWDRGMVV